MACPTSLSPLPPDLFSRTYSLATGPTSIIYRTHNQAIAVLDGDSAEVWRRIFDNHGNLDAAVEYIATNGTFEGDREQEARGVLEGFLRDLVQEHVLGERRPQTEITQFNSMRSAAVPENLEHAFKQTLAHNRVCCDLVLELTYRCNERCRHCYLPEHRSASELSLDEIDSLLHDFCDLGGCSVALTGGEILTRADILDVLALVGRSRLVPSLASNLLLLDESTLGAMVALCPRSVGCSIYSARPDLHDAVTRVPGSLNKSLRSIERLREAGISVVMKTPILKATAPHWREVEELADRLGCALQLDLSITARNDGKLTPLTERVTDPAIIQEIFSSRFYSLSYSGEQIAQMTGPCDEAGLCGAGAIGLTVGPSGEIRPCVGLNISLGNVRENGIAEVWRNSPFLREFGAIRAKDVEVCSHCKDFAMCFRCPGAWLAEHGSYRKPTEYACFLGHALARAQRDAHEISKRKEVKP